MLHPPSGEVRDHESATAVMSDESQTVPAKSDGAAQIKNSAINWMRSEQGYFIIGIKNLPYGRPPVFKNRPPKDFEHCHVQFSSLKKVGRPERQDELECVHSTE